MFHVVRINLEREILVDSYEREGLTEESSLGLRMQS